LLLVSREQFKWFLELLLTRLAAGSTLERAMTDSLPGLSQMLGNQSDLLTALRRFTRQLTAGQSPDTLLTEISGQLICPEARLFFRLAPELRRTGSHLTQFVRQHVHMVSEQLDLQQDIQAEATQRRTEAVLLALMPFLLALLLRASFDVDTAALLNGLAGLTGMAVAFVLAAIAAVLTVGLLSFLPDRRRTRRPVTARRHAAFRLPGRMLHHLYRDILPESYGSRLLRLLLEKPTGRPEPAATVLDPYFARKGALILVALLPALLLTAQIPAAWPALLGLPALVCLLQDHQVFTWLHEKERDYRLDYPVFLNLIVALLQSGLSLHRALQIGYTSLLSERTAGPAPSAFISDLTEAQRQIQVGLPVEQVIEHLTDACPLPEARAALLLLQRYEHAGGGDTLQLLALQASSCWSLHRSTLKKQMEQQALRLLLPMMLDLLAVLLTAMLPAVLSLQTF
jgi:Flp pilus assembly protein TadB